MPNQKVLGGAAEMRRLKRRSAERVYRQRRREVPAAPAGGAGPDPATGWDPQASRPERAGHPRPGL